jgi:hypothetical protein
MYTPSAVIIFGMDMCAIYIKKEVIIGLLLLLSLLQINILNHLQPGKYIRAHFSTDSERLELHKYK